MSCVLVTGAAGFVGGHLLEHLSGTCELVAWARSEPRAELAPLAAWRRGDLLDRDLVRREVRDLRPAAIYHCAGAPHVGASWHNTAEPLAANVLTTHYLLDAARRAGIACRVLITGSAMVYAPSRLPLREDDPLAPTSPYGLSKLAQEQLGARATTEDGIGVVLTRPFNHIGPRQRPTFAASGIARQIAVIERGGVEPVLKVGNLDAERDLTDVRDTVRAYALLMDRGTPGTAYNVATGVARAIRDVLDALVRRSRVRVEVAVDPERLRPQDTPVLVGDASRLRSATGWSPAIPFDRTLDDLLEYWRRAVRDGGAG
ncbi:MAG: GDP-mannose 4,6-dehydratase [Acidobacteria bacterium]|nr:GDP-mannose 4,6-dehydratase [Acidobacteriota bacterium]